MIDSIELGSFFANIFIGFLLFLVSIEFIILRKYNKYIVWIWLSCSLNIISILYFLGDTSYVIPVVNVFIWPVINIILIIWYVKNKKH